MLNNHASITSATFAGAVTTLLIHWAKYRYQIDVGDDAGLIQIVVMGLAGVFTPKVPA